jgi:hypothetical protein
MRIRNTDKVCLLQLRHDARRGSDDRSSAAGRRIDRRHLSQHLALPPDRDVSAVDQDAERARQDEVNAVVGGVLLNQDLRRSHVAH